ncbi:MAG TPA: PTS fructose transporter subunit IIC [Rariglobus sp.]|jgi:fructose-specific phosphotransferase system IIC component|nr:PTS fructose transporter subunit IIC [Rariglobus sp.]
MKEQLQKVRQYLLSGVSFAIPFIACGGILIAAATAFAPMTSTGADFSGSPILKLILDIGVTSFTLMLPVLAGYIAYAMASKPGLVPGFIGGYLAGHLDGIEGKVSAGFLGALVAGLLAGYVVNVIKKLPVPAVIRPIMPILIIPIFSSLIVGIVMLKVVGVPIAEFMKMLEIWLQTMNQGNAVVLALILGSMIAFDMGGPINKAAFFFGSAMISQGNVAIMGCIAAAICTPPLGMGLATFLNKSLWTEEQREAGKAAFAMGMVGITEGAIPFAAGEPFRVIPCLVAGSATAAVIAMLGGVGDQAPHGGPIVLPVVNHRLMYVVAIIAGTFVTALSINFIKQRACSKKQTANSTV